MTTPTGDPWLLTPGPVTTSVTVKQAMLHDWGSRDETFMAIDVALREQLLSLANGQGSHVLVPLQGSGTFAVEAMLDTFLSPEDRLLILNNGAYGERMAKICRRFGYQFESIAWPENEPVDPRQLDQALACGDFTHVAVVHCETSSGILNPLREISNIVARYGRGLLVDSISSFGGFPIYTADILFDALVISANKCLESIPGVAFVMARRSALELCEGNAHSLSLDLYDQWQVMEASGQWRFTPPTHVISACHTALQELAAEGGVKARYARYRLNCRLLIDGMRALGFETLLCDELQSPIIVSFRMPTDPRFSFEGFYGRLRQKGFLIYPGKLSMVESFRIGCIGRLGQSEMQDLVSAVEEVMNDMGVMSGASQ